MSERGDRLAELVAEHELDCFLVTDLVNVGYLTGFGGTNGACVCGADRRVFLTDFRYTERAEAEIEGWEVVTVSDDWLGGIAARLIGKVGFEDHHMAVRTMKRLEESRRSPADQRAGHCASEGPEARSLASGRFTRSEAHG